MEGEEEMDESVMNIDNKSQKSEKEPVKEPIMVNLYERPSQSNLEQLNRKMKTMEENK